MIFRIGLINRLIETVAQPLRTENEKTQNNSRAYAQSSTNQAGLTGFFIGAEGSYNWANLDIIPGIQVTSEKNKVIGYRIFAGYNLNENIVFELGYFGTTNFRQSGAASSPGGSASYDISMKVSGGELSAMYKFTQGIPGLFIKAGVTYSKAAVSGARTILGVSTSVQDDETGAGYLYGLGYEANLYERLNGRIAYTRYERIGGESDNKMNTFSIGLKYSF